MLSEILLTLVQCVRGLLTWTRPWSDRLLDLVYRLVMGASLPLPPIDDPLLLMPATLLADKIRKRQLSSERVVRAYISRCQSVQRCVNAVTDERYDDALLEARRIDEMLASSTCKSERELEQDTPLLGVPFSCKEALGVKGLMQTSGLTRFRGRVAPSDSDAAALYRRSGAIPLTVTDVPELCMWWESNNRLFGLTRNPYCNYRTPGGSTGGEGALLTSAGAVIGIGTDIGGSIRIPSSFCGIYGHKPSKGVVSNWGIFPYSKPDHVMPERSEQFSCTGPMCRYVQDLPLLMRILSNNDTRLQLDEKVHFSKVSVYYIEQLPGKLFAPTTDVRQAVRKAAQHFEKEYGVQAQPLYLEELRYAFQIWETRLLEFPAPPLGQLLCEEGRSVTWEMCKKLFGCSSDYTLPVLFFALIEKRERDDSFHFYLSQFQLLKDKLEQLLQHDSILLIPTHPEPAPHLFMTIPKFANIAYTGIFNALGFPATNIPAGLSNGLPFGIQAVSGPYQDRLTLAAAVELDRVFGGWKSPCPLE